MASISCWLEDPNNILIKKKMFWEIKHDKYVKTDICESENFNKLFYVQIFDFC